MSYGRSAIMFVLCVDLAACSGNSALNRTGNSGGAAGANTAGSGGTAGGSGGAAGAAGGPQVDVSQCIPIEVGPAYSSEFIRDAFYVRADVWMGRARVSLQLALHPPKVGEFDFDAPVNRSFETCTECLVVTNFRDDGTRQSFLARYGQVGVDQIPDSVGGFTVGTFDNVVLYEAVIDYDVGVATPVVDGGCLFLAAGAWDTAPCEPGTSCGSGFECMPTYYSTSGACNPIGSNLAGQMCSERVPSTDCEAGLLCADGLCRTICDFWSSTTSCSSGSLCGPTGICVPVDLDDALLGEVCSNGPGWWCGNDGARYAGYCVDTVSGAICRPICRMGVATDCEDNEACEPFEGYVYGTCVASP